MVRFVRLSRLSTAMYGRFAGHLPRNPDQSGLVTSKTYVCVALLNCLHMAEEWATEVSLISK